MRAVPGRRTVAYVACLALAVVCCACACGSASADHADGTAQPGAVITVGSFDFPESVLLADIYAGALTAQGFPVRVLPDLGGLLGLKQVYGLRFRVFIPLDAGGPLTLQALQAGDIGVALLFGTDPAITADHLVVLADDRGLQPAENVVPLVRRDVVGRYGPRLLAVLNTVSARLTTGSLRALNTRVELRGQDPRLVAQSWLRTQGLASTGEVSR